MRTDNNLCWADEIHDPYFEAAEDWTDVQLEQIILPFIDESNLHGVVLDLACGRGRWSDYMKRCPAVKRVYAVDREEQNVRWCNERFATDEHVEALQTDGYQIPIEDDQLDFLFCFDSMVHFDVDIVLAYLLETKRVLKPGGRAFFHHSNYNQQIEVPILSKPHLRNFMDKRLFSMLADYAGLSVVRQQVMDWGGEENLELEIDCLSLLENPSI